LGLPYRSQRLPLYNLIFAVAVPSTEVTGTVFR